MSSTPLARALLHAYRDRFTGFIRISWSGRTSSLSLRDGDLVDMDVRFGHQSWAQALLQSGQLSLHALDEIWARGAVAVAPDEALLGLPVEVAEQARLLANVRQMSAAGESIELEPFEVEPRFRLEGTRAVRAALEAIDVPAPENTVGSTETVALADASTALLEPVDSAEGSTQPLEFEDEITQPVQFEEQCTEPLEPVAAAADAPEPPQASESEITGQGWDGIPNALEPSEEEEISGDPTLTTGWTVDPDPEALAAARRRAQEDLVQEMNEALRRAGAPPAESWLEEEVGPLEGVPVFEGVELSAEPAPEDADVQDDSWRMNEAGLAEESPRVTETLASDSVRRANVAFPDLATAPWDQEIPPMEQAILEAEPSWVRSSPTTADLDDSGSASVHTHSHDELAEDWQLDDEEDLASDPSDPAEAARLRRQRLLRRAMQNMGTLPRPERPHNAQAVPPAAPAAPAEAPVGSGAASADERRIAAAIEERHRALANKPTHYAVLGINQNATKEQVKAGFLELAKMFHPDRLPASLSSLAPKMTSIFEAIREAYEVLYDDRRRSEYTQGLQHKAEKPKGAPDPMAALQASEEFKKGEALFRKRDFEKAEEHYVRAHALEPRPDFLAARAWAIYMDPDRKHEAARARQMILDALKANPACDRAHYQLGLIARMDNDIAAAERHFRDAVKANPRHLEASQELRLIEMRKKKSGKKGLFS